MDAIILKNIESRMNDEEKHFLGYSKYDMDVVKNLFPYDEFLGTDYKTYYISHTEPELLATYFLTKYTETYSHNVLYRVYQTEITDKKLGTYTAVFAGYAEDLIKYKDGTIYLDSSHLESNERNIICYPSLDSFETECIESKKSEYDIEKM